MKPVVLALGVALLGTLAACDTYDHNYRSNGLSGSRNRLNRSTLQSSRVP